jgi:8-oxo-dGTP pyrophosphatase MutT (NUDIX family)
MSADGAFLLGVMSSHTFNGGRIYFPCGTPDPGIIVDGKVDLGLSLRRELKEETGLDMTAFDVEPGWIMSVDGALIAQIKLLRSNESANALRERILAYLASEKRPELAGYSYRARSRRFRSCHAGLCDHVPDIMVRPRVVHAYQINGISLKRVVRQ